MTERHDIFGPDYAFSDYKRGDTISYHIEGRTEASEIVWVAVGRKLPTGKDMPPHYVVAPEGGGFPEMVLFGDVVADVQ